eukprot:763235-Hanusia_phi.AAC.2
MRCSNTPADRRSYHFSCLLPEFLVTFVEASRLSLWPSRASEQRQAHGGRTSGGECGMSWSRHDESKAMACVVRPFRPPRTNDPRVVPVKSGQNMLFVCDEHGDWSASVLETIRANQQVAAFESRHRDPTLAASLRRA